MVSGKTLTTPVNTGTAITDHLGNTFASIPAFAKAYNIPVRQAYDRIANHFSVIETLDYIPLINHLIKNYKFDDKLIIIEKLANEKKQNRNKDPYYKCLFNNHEVILTRDFIIQYCTKELRKQHAQTQTAS